MAGFNEIGICLYRHHKKKDDVCISNEMITVPYQKFYDDDEFIDFCEDQLTTYINKTLIEKGKYKLIITTLGCYFDMEYTLKCNKNNIVTVIDNIIHYSGCISHAHNKT